MVAMSSSRSPARGPIGRGLGCNLITFPAERPLLLKEHPDLRIAHPQRDELLAAPALDVELDHPGCSPLLAEKPCCHERALPAIPIRRGAHHLGWQPACHADDGKGSSTKAIE